MTGIMGDHVTIISTVLIGRWDPGKIEGDVTFCNDVCKAVLTDLNSGKEKSFSKQQNEERYEELSKFQGLVSVMYDLLYRFFWMWRRQFFFEGLLQERGQQRNGLCCAPTERHQ